MPEPESIHDQPAPPPDVFISYSRRDTARVLELTERLKRHSVSVWMDQTGIDATERWSQEIVEAITGCKVFLFVASAKSFESENVTKELSLASEEKKPILAVYLESVVIPSTVRYQLVGIQHLEYFGDGVERAFDSMLRALRKNGVRTTKADTQPVARERGSSRSMPRRTLALALAGVLVAGAGVIAWRFGRDGDSARAAETVVTQATTTAFLVALPKSANYDRARVELRREPGAGPALCAVVTNGQAYVLFGGDGASAEAKTAWLHAQGERAAPSLSSHDVCFGPACADPPQILWVELYAPPERTDLPPKASKQFQLEQRELQLVGFDS